MIFSMSHLDPNLSAQQTQVVSLAWREARIACRLPGGVTVRTEAPSLGGRSPARRLDTRRGSERPTNFIQGQEQRLM